jgi:hypothetical protein
VINLRYHIVSITAVFLALGIGLAFGASFVDTATVSQLKNRLEGIEQQNITLEARTGRLEDRIRQLDDRDEALRQQGSGQLVAGRLQDVPVVILAVRGIDEDPVGAAADAVVAAGARFGGVLWFTDRLVLDDDAEVGDLAAALNVDSDDPAVLRATLIRRLGAILTDAATPITAAPVDPAVDPALDPAATTVPEPTTVVDSTPRPVPELVQSLIAAQFLELEPPAASPGDFALLPEAGARYLVASGTGAVLPDHDLLLPLLRTVTLDAVAGQPSPVAVAVQSGPAFDADPPADADPAADRVAFVGPIRAEDGLRDRLSTVDDLETFAGQIAAVLALEDGGTGLFGHYGVGDGAQSLLPAPPAPEPGG